MDFPISPLSNNTQTSIPPSLSKKLSDSDLFMKIWLNSANTSNSVASTKIPISSSNQISEEEILAKLQSFPTTSDDESSEISHDSSPFPPSDASLPNFLRETGAFATVIRLPSSRSSSGSSTPGSLMPRGEEPRPQIFKELENKLQSLSEKLEEDQP